MKYRKKPVVIEAMKWQASDLQEVTGCGVDENVIKRIDETLDYFQVEFSKDSPVDEKRRHNIRVWQQPISDHSGGISPNDLVAIRAYLSQSGGDDFDYFRVREWALSKPRKRANTAFTSSTNRNVAYLIEEIGNQSSETKELGTLSRIEGEKS